MSRSGGGVTGFAMDVQAVLRQRTYLALYVAAATVLFVLERLLPNPLPWVRLGLANGVVLLVLVRHGAAAALGVQLGRIFLGSLYAGAFLGPTFLLALAGGCASWVVMAAAWRTARAHLSLLGISTLGAVAHGLAQLVLVSTLFHAGPGIFTLLPLFLGVALVTGACIGIVAQALFLRLVALQDGSGS